MFGRSDDDNSVLGWSSDRDVDDVDIFKGPGALQRAERSTFGGGDLNKFSRMAGTFGGMLSKAGGFKPYDEKEEAFKALNEAEKHFLKVFSSDHQVFKNINDIKQRLNK